MNILTLLLSLIILSAVNTANSGCTLYLRTLFESVLSQNYAALPLPTIMYSGITTNNPGQMYECEHKTSAADPFHYMLVNFKNVTTSV